MNCSTVIPASLALALLVGCAPVQPPKADPLQEEVIILQKQLLELQKVQNETKTRLEESSGIIAGLSAKVQALEARQTARMTAHAPADKAAAASQDRKPPSQKNKTVKKAKKKVRRQE